MTANGTGPLLDSYRQVETPEGVELGLRIAGPPARFLAWVADTLIRFAAYIILSMPMALLGRTGAGLLLLLLFASEWLYPVLFEVRWRGATPGKRWLGLQVVQDDGTPVTWGPSMLRNLLRFVDFLPFGYGVGLAAMLVHPEFKRLGDLAAGTVVVHVDPAATGQGVVAAPPVPPPVPLSSAEQAAVVGFAERLPRWGRERAEEIAAGAEPLTGTTGPAAVERLLGMANWLLGRR